MFKNCLHSCPICIRHKEYNKQTTAPTNLAIHNDYNPVSSVLQSLGVSCLELQLAPHTLNEIR